jgi:hypothetical protein
VFGLSKNVTLALVGWLWADILLGLFVIFLAVSSVPVAEARVDPGIDPTPLEISVGVDGASLLSTDPDTVARERERFAAEVERQVAELAPGRRVAIVFAFGSHGDPVSGDRIARAAIEGLVQPRFAGAVLKAYHDIVAGDTGTAVALEIYFHR